MGTSAAPLQSERPVGLRSERPVGLQSERHEVSLREFNNLKLKPVMCQALRAQFYLFVLFYNHKDS